MFIADFHIHSKYSRATSEACVPEMLDFWARRKGLGLMGTGDFTHPAWREELKEKLVPAEEGLYTLKDDFRKEDNLAGDSVKPRFIVSGEISSIYKKNGKVRKVHNLILLPGLEEAEALSHRLEAIGNLHSDGRPILGLDSKDLLEITLEVCPNAIFIPAHIWTPHFSLFGAYSGFDDIRECFEDLTENIHALETGLSSDPPMNWRLSALDKYTLVSNSDAHSPANLAREANLFDTVLSYPHISRALQNRDTREFCGTIEFFPEEGKYHYDGHRNCKVCLKPADTRDASGICPVCGGKITVGVLHRVEMLADREEGFIPPAAKQFQSLVPLSEVIAASSGLTSASMRVKEKYEDLMRELGPELFILRQAQIGDIELKAGPLVAEGIRRLRSRQVEVMPGYDGEYGKIKILNKDEIDRISGQLGFFSEKENKSRKSTDRKSPKKPAKAAPAERIPEDMILLEKDADQAPAISREVFDGLNPAQQEAVSSSGPVIAVIAGPGTGKTRTLVSRIIYLTQRCGVPPFQIMAVTFTNRAAHEMRSRLAKYFGNKQGLKDLAIGTFHSICLQILSGQNGKSPITVIDEYDALSILEDSLKNLHLKNSPRDVLRGISLIKSGVRQSGEKTSIPPGVYEAYCAQLERYGVMDYDDILLKTLEQLESAPQIQARSCFHLLVDEFQDINAIQYRLIKAWGKNSAGIFVIGDPDQSIYGFRGSDASCFRQLEEDFPDIRQIRLTQNYRSTPEIVRCAQAVISKKNGGDQAYLLEARRESGPRVRLMEAGNEFSEALFVAKEINRLVGGIDMLDAHKSPIRNGKSPGSGVARGFSDIAVLYRTNRQAEVLEQCLLKEGIPYTVAGRDEFLLNREVRKTVAFFRFVLNPADLVSLGLCLKTMEVCQSDLLQKVLEDYALSEKNAASLAAVMQKHLFTTSADQDRKFLELLHKYTLLVRQEDPHKLIESWMNDGGLKNTQSLELLLNIAVLHPDMPSFLNNLLLGRESDVVRKGGRSFSLDAVSLMTLHGAKGLEFPVVFLCGIKEGLIPLQTRDGGCDIEEERRLFYVGLTRAQDELILLASNPKSPFLEGMPVDSLSTGKAFTGKKTPGSEQYSLFNI
jgi:uncharacterized protein (TIGR00375 family)